MSLADRSKNLRKWEWPLLLESLIAEEGQSEVFKRVAQNTIAADLEEMSIIYSKAELFKSLIGVADVNEFPRRRWSSCPTLLSNRSIRCSANTVGDLKP